MRTQMLTKERLVFNFKKRLNTGLAISLQKRCSKSLHVLKEADLKFYDDQFIRVFEN